MFEPDPKHSRTFNLSRDMTHLWLTYSPQNQTLARHVSRQIKSTTNIARAAHEVGRGL